MRKRGLTQPRRAVKPAPVPRPPFFVPPSHRPTRAKAEKNNVRPHSARVWAALWSATLRKRRQIFSAVSCYFAIPAKLRDLRREGRCYFLVSSLFAADLRQSQKKEARNRCGFGLLEKAIYLLENWGARRAALRPYCLQSYGRNPLILLGFRGLRLSVNPSTHPLSDSLPDGLVLGAKALFTTEDNCLGLLYFTFA